MSTIAVMVEGYKFNRERTLATLSAIEKESDPRAVLACAPGPAGRTSAGSLCTSASPRSCLPASAGKKAGGIYEAVAALPRRQHARRRRAGPGDRPPRAWELREHLLATIGGLDDTRLDLVPGGAQGSRLAALRGALDHRLARAPPSRAGTHYVQFVEIDAEREMMSGRGVGLETGGLRKKANHIASRLQATPALKGVSPFIILHSSFII